MVEEHGDEGEMPAVTGLVVACGVWCVACGAWACGYSVGCLRGGARRAGSRITHPVQRRHVEASRDVRVCAVRAQQFHHVHVTAVHAAVPGHEVQGGGEGGGRLELPGWEATAGRPGRPTRAWSRGAARCGHPRVPAGWVRPRERAGLGKSSAQGWVVSQGGGKKQI